MSLTDRSQGLIWPSWRKVIFRFLFIYLFLTMAPLTWLEVVPGISFITRYYYQLMDWAVDATNSNFFHVRKVLVPLNGSGDTSYGWAQVWLFVCIAVIGCIIWSVPDRHRKNYNHLNYWLCLFTRYYVSLIAFVYGIQKLFALQMPFPSQSQLATALGDFLPMRLSWMFLGYSAPYQVFAGVLELLAGILLLYRKTATLGILVAAGVFINVMMLNLSYDIPVKIFSIHIVLLCLFLLVNEYNRIVCFFILNKPAAACDIYHFSYSKKWMRVTRIALKMVFIIIAVIIPFFNTRKYYHSLTSEKEVTPIKTGLYNVAVYAVNRDTIPALINDTLRWQDVVFDKHGIGSIKTSDTIFRQRYKRGYFYYFPDTLKHTISFKKLSSDSAFIFIMRYVLPDSNTVRLWGKYGNDSLYVELKRSNRHFQLAERQFHWLSEYNR